jgi:hypothetical protein
MKSFLIALTLSAASLSAFAGSYFLDSASLYNCGGEVQLRTHANQGDVFYTLKFNNVNRCSNVVILGKKYKLTDDRGRFLDRAITLSRSAVREAKFYGLSISVESNTGRTSDSVRLFVNR